MLNESPIYWQNTVVRRADCRICGAKDALILRVTVEAPEPELITSVLNQVIDKSDLMVYLALCRMCLLRELLPILGEKE